MSLELIATIIAAAGIMLAIWRMNEATRKEARDAHEKIGKRIDTLESRIGKRFETFESKIGERIRAVESRIGTVESKIDKLTGYIGGYFKQDVPG